MTRTLTSLCIGVLRSNLYFLVQSQLFPLIEAQTKVPATASGGELARPAIMPIAARLRSSVRTTESEYHLY